MNEIIVCCSKLFVPLICLRCVVRLIVLYRVAFYHIVFICFNKVVSGELILVLSGLVPRLPRTESHYGRQIGNGLPLHAGCQQRWPLGLSKRDMGSADDAVGHDTENHETETPFYEHL
jgi:hypothetical protein